ncbi:hypothetical protein [Mycoplasma bradburyae]|uniref:hypothetical protein n=1 Tax=Mycoplasma bradburyae TaxID=2963128 RepID=UPI0020CB9826|nr:hypothetical protein [Mycoplasma bradburyae]UTS71064.1 hypothetical protein NMG77_01190 [Mycoplasma bradburyae]
MIDYKDIIVNALIKNNWTIAIIESHSNGIIANALLVSNKLDKLFNGSMIFKNSNSINNFIKLNKYQPINNDQIWSINEHDYISQIANRYFKSDVLINFVHFDQHKTKELIFSFIIKDKTIQHTIDLSKYESDNYIHPVSMILLSKLMEEIILINETKK